MESGLCVCVGGGVWSMGTQENKGMSEMLSIVGEQRRSHSFKAYHRHAVIV